MANFDTFDFSSDKEHSFSSDKEHSFSSDNSNSSQMSIDHQMCLGYNPTDDDLEELEQKRFAQLEHDRLCEEFEEDSKNNSSFNIAYENKIYSNDNINHQAISKNNRSNVVVKESLRKLVEQPTKLAEIVIKTLHDDYTQQSIEKTVSNTLFDTTNLKVSEYIRDPDHGEISNILNIKG